jgi:hypothetical protein
MHLRTAIYVAEPSTVTIRPLAPSQANATLYRFRRGAIASAFGVHQLDPGVYLVLSESAVEVTGPDLVVTPLSKDKDIPPEPKARVLAAEPGATTAEVHKFLMVFKDADPPARSSAPPVPPEDGPDGGEQDGEDDVEDE